MTKIKAVALEGPRMTPMRGFVLFAIAMAVTMLWTVINAPPADADTLPAAPWSANQQSGVVNPTTAQLQGDNTSIETGLLNLNVDEGDEISFDYQLVDGAECEAGAPRVFAIVNGAAPPNNKSDHCDGAGDAATSGTIAFETDRAGLITQFGLVYDSGRPGHVLVSNVRVDGELILFQERVNHCADVTGDQPPVAAGRVEVREHIAKHVACTTAAQTGEQVHPGDLADSFSDVDKGDDYYSHVEYLAERDIALGFDTMPATFGPGTNVDRDQFVSFVARGVQYADDQGASGLVSSGTLGHEVFPDVNSANVHNENIGAFYDYDLVEGYENGEFGPDDDVIHNHVRLVVDERWPANQTSAP